ncbi:MAG: hypothetical protein R6X25_09375 [Candidatus Krumholzibacteriia bacterium]
MQHRVQSLGAGRGAGRGGNLGMDSRELRRFALVMTTGFAIAAALAWWRNSPVWMLFAVTSAAFLATGSVLPSALAPVERAWMKLAEMLAAVMTRVLLAATYFLLVTPLGLLARLTGKDFLSLKRDRIVESYWVSVEEDGPHRQYRRPY